MLASKLLRTSLLLAFVGLSAACSGAEGAAETGDEDEIVAERPGEYDPGPPAGSGWAELFAETPNYRQISRDIAKRWLTPGPDGKRPFDVANAELVAAGKKPMKMFTFTGDKFRYSMGPVFYRGRLDGSAKVLVVGQDPSTDEAMVHRAMVGGTGQKVQSWLSQIGIKRSYIILNTFAYGIFEQVDPFTEELATKSPIAEHRNKLFEHAFKTNKIEIIISIGSGAHKSVAQWLEQLHGGKVPDGVLHVQTLHPGTAAFGFDPDDPDAPNPELDKVIASFENAWRRVWAERAKRPGFARPDPGARTTPNTKYFYSSNEIPFRDLPYGFETGLGRGGTKTERDGTTRIQFRSPNGVRLEAPNLPKPRTVSRELSGFLQGEKDVAWEPSRTNPMAFDPGPSKAWVDTFLATPPLATVLQEAAAQPLTDFATPVWYRGKINGGSKILVVGQGQGVDGVVGGRAMIGDDGQHVEHLMDNVGAGSDYLVIQPYPYVVSKGEDVAKLAMTSSLTKFRNEILQKIVKENGVKAVITLGQLGKDAFEKAATGFTGPVIELPQIDESGAHTKWNAAIDRLKNEAAAIGLQNGKFQTYASADAFKNARRAIPRDHLPYGKPLWFGSTGTLSQIASKEWLFWCAPAWIDDEKPAVGP
jgi:hypothetical protein